MADATPRTLRFAASLVCVTGFALTIVTSYPGRMSPDSLDQYHQGLAFSFSDGHPPILAFIWSLMDLVYAGPQSMLISQAGAFWSILYLLITVRAYTNIYTQFVLPVCLFLSPPMFGILGVIWKDVHLALSWGLAVTLVFYFRSTTGSVPRCAKIAAMVFVIYGVLVRHNAFMGAPPILLYVLRGTPCLRSVVRTLAAYAMIAVFSYGALQITSKYVFRASETNVFMTLPIFDWAGITAKTGENVFPVPFDENEKKKLIGCYTPNTSDPYRFGDCSFVYDKLAGHVSKSEIYRRWLAEILQHPWQYVEHRVEAFGSALCVYRCTEVRQTSSHNAFSVMKKYYAEGFTHTYSIVWLILGVVLGWLSVRASDPAGVALNLSATLYILSLLPFGVASSFRYIYPSVVFIMISAVILLQRFHSPGKQPVIVRSSDRPRQDRNYFPSAYVA